MPGCEQAATSEPILDAAGIAAVLDRLVGYIRDRTPDPEQAGLIGIQSRGDVLARRSRQRLSADHGLDLPCGSLDITLYRDDFDSLHEQPLVGHTSVPFPVEGKTVFLIDDVLFTGRTVRAALDEIVALGRPARVVLLVLVDRGGRELPIQADFVGVALQIEPHEQVQLMLDEVDGREGLQLFRTGQSGHV